MVEKIEVRIKDNGGHVVVTRCDGGIAWVEMRRADGTTPGNIRLTMSERTDLALALDQGLTTREEATNLREKYDAACKSSVVNADLAYQKDQYIKAIETSQSHGAYQKLNDELARTKAEVNDLTARLILRGDALAIADKAVDLWKKTAHDRLAQVAMWEKEATLRAENHERLTAVAGIFQCPAHDVVAKAEALVRRHAELCATVSDGEGYVAGETWKQRDARHRATIHQLKQENHNRRQEIKTVVDECQALKGKVAAARATWSAARPEVAPADAAHVMSLTEQLDNARSAHRFCESHVASWIRSTEMWKAKYDKQCKELEDLKLAGKIYAEAWRQGLTDALELPADSLFHNITLKIRELKALASTESQVRMALENKHHEWMAIKADHAKMLQLREADVVTVKRCSDRVKELEQRAMVASAALDGRNAR